MKEEKDTRIQVHLKQWFWFFFPLLGGREIHVVLILLVIFCLTDSGKNTGENKSRIK